MTLFVQKSPEIRPFIYIPDFSREFRTLNPALQDFRMVEPEIRNGVWDSGIPDLVHVWYDHGGMHTNLVQGNAQQTKKRTQN